MSSNRDSEAGGEGEKGALLRADLDGGVTRLSLASGSGNPINSHLVAALLDELDRLEASPPRALLLDGGAGRLFSGGLDVKELVGFDRDQIIRFFRDFSDVLIRLTTLKTPTVVAIHGHAIAGGFILGLAFDFRVVQRGALKLGLSEVDLGLPVPAGTQVLLRERTSPQVSARLCAFATLISPEEAHAVGYADFLAADVSAEALALAQTLAAKPGPGVAVGKSYGVSDLARRAREAEETELDAFIALWCSDDAQARIRALAARL